jgi:hypothetical protein
MRRRRISDAELAAWFSYDPVSKAVPKSLNRPAARQQKAVRGR